MIPIAGVTQPPGGQRDQIREADIGTETFLTLLITQLRSQNPLEPMDPNEFVAQLAQFNSLSQLIEIKQLLAKANEGRADGSAGSAGAGSPAGAPGGVG